MKKILIITLAILIWMFTPAFAGVDTVNTVPAADSSFLTNLTTFLEQEDADRVFPRLAGVVLEGGYHSTDADLTATLPAIVAFPEGHYVSMAAKAHTYTASKRTFVYVRDDDTRTLTWAGATITYDDHYAFAETTSATSVINTPTGFLPVMYADTDGDNVTSGTDQRSGSVPAEYYTSFSAALTASVNRTLCVNEWHVLTANTATTASNHVICGGKARIILGAYNLTIGGGFDAPAMEVLDDSGTGSITWDSVDRIILGQWTGDSFIKTYVGSVLVHTIDTDYGTLDAKRSSFQVKPASAQDDINMNAGSAVTVVWGTEVYDVNADFASNTFTAPIAGKYHFDVILYLGDIDQTNTAVTAYLDFSTGTDVSYSFDPAVDFSGDATQHTVAFSITQAMAAAETVTVTMESSVDGADQTDIETNSRWSGYLVH